MAYPGLTAFRAIPTAAASQGTPDTVTIAVKSHGLSSTTLAANGSTGAGGVDGPVNSANSGESISGAVAAAVPAPASGPAFVCSGVPGGTVKIYNPTNGQLVYIGVDGTLNATTGYALNPGVMMSIQTYQGSVWALAASVATTLYYINQGSL